MKYINTFNTKTDFDNEKTKMDMLPHFVSLIKESNTIHIKKKYSFHYRITDYLINNIQPSYDNKLPLISRCDLFRRIYIDGVEVDLNDKVRTPHIFTTSGNDLIFELGSLILTDNGFNEKYVLTKHFDSPVDGIIEVEFNEDIPEIIGAFMFNTCITSIDKNIFALFNPTSLMSLFSTCSILKNINLSYLNSINVNNMFSMFANCNELTEIIFDNVDTSKVTDMNSMFMSCNNLLELDLTHFNTSNVTNMYSMFLNCKKLHTLDLSSFDTSNVIDMESMFDGCINLNTLKLNNFSFKNVSDMAHMFHNCTSLNEITCTQEFKDWCIENQDIIELPFALRERGDGKWNIINAD